MVCCNHHCNPNYQCQTSCSWDILHTLLHAPSDQLPHVLHFLQILFLLADPVQDGVVGPQLKILDYVGVSYPVECSTRAHTVGGSRSRVVEYSPRSQSVGITERYLPVGCSPITQSVEIPERYIYRWGVNQVLRKLLWKVFDIRKLLWEIFLLSHWRDFMCVTCVSIQVSMSIYIHLKKSWLSFTISFWG